MVLSAKGIEKTMGQGNTVYNVLPIRSSTNPIQFQQVITTSLDNIE